MKGIIVFKGKYGATRQYAEWLAQDLNLPASSADRLSPLQLRGYDVILIGTSVYLGKLTITGWLKQNLQLLTEKKIFLFLVSATPPREKDKLDSYIQAGIPGEIRNNCEIYYLPGRMILKNLSWKDRFMLGMVARLIKGSNKEKKLLTDFDRVKKEHLAEMIEAAGHALAPGKIVVPA